MTISAKLSASELLRLREVFWTPNFWLNLFNHVLFHDLGFFWVMISVSLAALACSVVRQPWQRPLIVLFALAGAAVIAGRMRRKLRLSPREVARLNHGSPRSFTIDDERVTILDEKGLSTSVPWRLFVHWQDAESVLIANFGAADKILVVPCEQLSLAEAAYLRATLQAHIGPALPLAPNGSVRLLKARSAPLHR